MGGANRLSPYASPSATREVLERHGLYTKYALGQNFLVNDDVIRKIIELADGVNGKITINSKVKDLTPVAEYLGLQGRFRHLRTEEQKAAIQEYITQCHERTMKRLTALSVD